VLARMVSGSSAVSLPSAAPDDLAYEALCSLCDDADAPHPPPPPSGCAALLSDALIAYGGECSEATLAAVDRLRAAAPPPPSCLPAAEALWLDAGATAVAVHRGELCALRVDAIVTAANASGLGCFVPAHRCVDNAVHRAAGPRLRAECRRRMAERGGPLSAGSAPLLTAAYGLPAKCVLHVTGPQLARGGVPTEEERAQLRACYRGCLDRARDAGLRSLGFCCISTGLFCFPPREAARLALSKLQEWLEADEANAAAIELVVFDVFSDADQRIYEELAPAFFARRE